MRTAVRRATADDAEAIADVHIETWRVAYRGQLPDAFLELHERRADGAMKVERRGEVELREVRYRFDL